jgi:alkanesulfonate monooxygenase SsuD/methylene tetrahydromethanopterin reductase-like flavin-dependent oxidoreductase (luciferase family)
VRRECLPPIGERFEKLEETLQICEQMWSHNNGPFKGKHYRLAETLCAPQPIPRPRPPILIGGEGEKETLRLVARHADVWNASPAAGPGRNAAQAGGFESPVRRCRPGSGAIRKTVGILADPLADVDGFVSTAAGYRAGTPIGARDDERS